MKKSLLLFIGLVMLFPMQACSINNKIANFYYKSYNYEKAKSYISAIRALIPIYKKYPKGYTVNLRLGWLYYLDKKYANSIEHYEIARRVDPYSIEPLLGLSLPLMAEQKWGRVGSLMYEVIKKDYYNYYGNLRLSIALRMQKKFGLAERIDRKMLILYPTDVNFLTELGLSLEGEGKTRAARNIFSSVLILYPQSITAKSFLNNKGKK